MPDESPTPLVLVATEGAVATVTLNRPDRGNGLTNDLREQLISALDAIEHDESIRAVVLTGAGKAFCAGQDLAEHAASLKADPVTAFDLLERHYHPIVLTLTRMPKPVIAAINGACVGAGLSLALACDLRVASSIARFGTAFTAIGLTCDSGLSATLPLAVGSARASELIMLAEPFGADQALEWGLVGRVAAPEELASAAAELAQRLAAGPTRAYAEVKQALAATRLPALADVLRSEADAQARLGQTSDHQGAVAAFLAKQQPEFTGS